VGSWGAAAGARAWLGSNRCGHGVWRGRPRPAPRARAPVWMGPARESSKWRHTVGCGGHRGAWVGHVQGARPRAPRCPACGGSPRLGARGRAAGRAAARRSERPARGRKKAGKGGRAEGWVGRRGAQVCACVCRAGVWQGGAVAARPPRPRGRGACRLPRRLLGSGAAVGRRKENQGGGLQARARSGGVARRAARARGGRQNWGRHRAEGALRRPGRAGGTLRARARGAGRDNRGRSRVRRGSGAGNQLGGKGHGVLGVQAGGRQGPFAVWRTQGPSPVRGAGGSQGRTDRRGGGRAGRRGG
jgi:hypothetical protein